MATIDVGPDATDRAAYNNAGYTEIQNSNAADGTGTITSVEIWAYSNMAGVKIGTFYGSGTSYTCRAYATIPGTITAGSKQTYAVNIAVETGDLLGVYWSSGQIEGNGNAGGGSIFELLGDQFDTGAQTYDQYTNYLMSVYGAGATYVPRASVYPKILAH